jgi:hypothetical protein
MAPIAFQSILSFQVGVDDSSKEDKMRQRLSQCLWRQIFCYESPKNRGLAKGQSLGYNRKTSGA